MPLCPWSQATLQAGPESTYKPVAASRAQAPGGSGPSRGRCEGWPGQGMSKPPARQVRDTPKLRSPQARGPLSEGHRKATCQLRGPLQGGAGASLLCAPQHRTPVRPKAPSSHGPETTPGPGQDPGPPTEAAAPATPQGPDSAAGRATAMHTLGSRRPSGRLGGGLRRAAGMLKGQVPGTGRDVGSHRPLLTRCPRPSPQTGSPATPVGKGLHSWHPALGAWHLPGRRGLGTLAWGPWPAGQDSRQHLGRACLPNAGSSTVPHTRRNKL